MPRAGLLIGVAAICVVVVVVAAAIGAKDEPRPSIAVGAAAAAGPVATAAPAAQAPPAAATPRTGVAECDELAELNEKVKSCAAMPAELKKGIHGMVDNKLEALRGTPSASWIEYIRPKCASTRDYVTDSLRDHACGGARRARTTGYSVALASGWRELKAKEPLASELMLQEELPELGHSRKSGMYIVRVPRPLGSDSTRDASSCKALGEQVAGNQNAVLDSASLTTTHLGPACQTIVHDHKERRMTMSIRLEVGYSLVVTCFYGLDLSEPPAPCREMIGSIALE